MTYASVFPVTPVSVDLVLGGGEDAFVVKLNQACNVLVYATYLGGSGYDMGRGIAVDAAGSAYVTGQSWSSDFPSTLGAYATSLKSAIGVFVAKLYPDASNLAYATVLGSTPFDHGLAVAVDAAGSAYVTGIVVTGNFPTTPGAFDPTHNGSDDAFLVKLNPAGSALTYATFLGGAGTDAGYGVVVDGEGGAYVTGLTMSGDFPTTPGAFDSGLGGGGDAFVVKLNPAGSGLVYSTFLGGNREDRSRAIKIDSVGSAYLVGTTESGDFPVTPSAFNPTPGGAEDVFVAKLNPVGSELAYATYLGSNSPDWGEAITLDGQGNVYVVGDTNSSDFPTTPGAFDTSFNGAKDAFVAKLDVYVPNVVAPIEQPRPGGWISGTLTLRGFALDWGSATGPGIDAVRVYLDGPMGSGALLGNATYGLTRPDVAAQYGAAFAPSGWELAWDTTGLPLGIHRLHLYAHRVTDGVWTARPSHLVIIVGEHVRWLPIVLRRQ